MPSRNKIPRTGIQNIWTSCQRRASKSTNSWAHSTLANPQITKITEECQSANPQIFIINPQIANQQVSKKYCKTLCQKSRLSFKLIFYFCINFNWTVYALFVRSKSMYLWGCGSFSSAKKTWVANRKSTKHNSAND